ncbi:hypothetical protein PJE062_4818 [Pseudovibrio sp. JE062]|nr:hypothetical protein PJE062_4818 [Pseudovibrio sp. JE062]
MSLRASEIVDFLVCSKSKRAWFVVGQCDFGAGGAVLFEPPHSLKTT